MKYKLKFVNDGKPFELKPWTVDKHEKLLSELAKYEKTDSESEYDRRFRLTMMLMSLREVDEKVKEDDLMGMHPDDFTALFSAIYHAGKKGIVDEDFQKKEGKK